MSDAPATDTLLESLRQSGAWRLDPVRWRFLEALARRLPAQPAPVRERLQQRLDAAVEDYAQRWAGAGPAAGTGLGAGTGAGAAAGPARARTVPARCVPLAELNAHIRAASPTRRADAAETTGAGELASVRRFRQAWSRSRTERELAQATTRRPANAGPLNSHALLLQSLELMRELSPDYLRRFLVHVEALQWLDAARQAYPRPKAPAAARRARAPRPRK